MKHQLLVFLQCPRAGRGNQGAEGNRFAPVVRKTAGNLRDHLKNAMRKHRVFGKLGIYDRREITFA